MEIQLVFYNSFDNRKKFEMESGSRTWHALLLLKEGSCSFEIDGKSYYAEKNEVLFFPSNHLLHRKVLEPISFHQFAFYVAPKHPYFAPMEPGVLHIPKEHVQHLIEILDKLRVPSMSSRERIYCDLLNQIILENYIYQQKEDESLRKLDPSVSDAIQYIKDHISEKIEIPDIAKHVHLSNVGLIWKTKHCLNCTPAEMVRALRMQYARYLLLETHKPIKEIAEMCGYSNPFYFSNVFHRFFHISPSRCAEVMNSLSLQQTDTKAPPS